MTWIKRYALASILLVFGEVLFAVEISDRTGRMIDVEVLSVENTRIEIRMANGQTTWLERSRLSDESDAEIDSIFEGVGVSAADLNEALGVDLFVDGNLWDDTAHSVAERLRWPLESRTATQSSFRFYPPASYQILDARPFSAALYGDRGFAQALSLVFANKGDFEFSDPPTGREISEMERAIDGDAEVIAKKLTDVLGVPIRQHFGVGRGLTQSVDRWDWTMHAFLLAKEDEEYVSLRIMKDKVADDRGRFQRLSDAELRSLVRENVTRDVNGDVLIRNIPMVDQGPKGYCVPATFERYLRYLQIPADMYILAMAGRTEVGGGTYLSDILEEIRGYTASQNRSIKVLRDEVEIRTVRKYIDQGLPLMWAMFSSAQYNQFVEGRSIERMHVTSWDSWKERNKSELRSVELTVDYASAHVCMIVGYNDQTSEIAVSDSWGPDYELRWVQARHAEQVSQGRLYLIEF